MSFQPPLSIAKALQQVSKHEFVLPAIQREFVWSPAQICRLFDSLMRGYPFGSFLFWKVERENCRKYAWFDFVRNYHQRDAAHCPPLNLKAESSLIAVLDGQQRLTALNIGLRGTHASKLAYKRKDSAWAYPKKQLYLDLRSQGSVDELDMQYRFRFLTQEQAAEETSAGAHWFEVASILTMDAGKGIFAYVRKHDLADDDAAYETLDKLHDVVHRREYIHYFLEEEQDLDRVLNIFIRVNSGGTVLSYADLLLSIATAQWKERDAREAVHTLVDELNDVRFGFDFSKDMVLKACLVLADIPDVAFKVTNFTAENTQKIERGWDAMASALRLGAMLLGDFGFSARTLTANNVLIPIAYYVLRRGLTETYRTSKSEAADRENLRSWIVRSLVKAGTWGSGLDTLLRALRDALSKHGAAGFPVAELEAAMVPLGKSLRFEEDEIESLLEVEYGKRETFAILALLYPGRDLRNEFHEDHVFPKSQFRRQKLVALGLTPEVSDEWRELMNQLPNLQLLEGSANVQKAAMLPAEWMKETFIDDVERQAYAAKHDLVPLPETLPGFVEFFNARRTRMAERLRRALDVRGN